MKSTTEKSGTIDIVEQLEKLEKLRADGALSDDEFQKLKEKLIPKSFKGAPSDFTPLPEQPKEPLDTELPISSGTEVAIMRKPVRTRTVSMAIGMLLLGAIAGGAAVYLLGGTFSGMSSASRAASDSAISKKPKSNGTTGCYAWGEVDGKFHPECLANNEESSKEKLNKTLKKLSVDVQKADANEASNPETGSPSYPMLVAEQRAWTKFSNVACLYYDDSELGRTNASDCRVDVINARIKQLVDFDDVMKQ